MRKQQVKKRKVYVNIKMVKTFYDFVCIYGDLS